MHDVGQWEPPAAKFDARLKAALRTCPRRIGRRMTVQQFGEILATKGGHGTATDPRGSRKRSTRGAAPSASTNSVERSR